MKVYIALWQVAAITARTITLQSQLRSAIINSNIVTDYYLLCCCSFAGCDFFLEEQDESKPTKLFWGPLMWRSNSIANAMPFFKKKYLHNCMFQVDFEFRCSQTLVHFLFSFLHCAYLSFSMSGQLIKRVFWCTMTYKYLVTKSTWWRTSTLQVNYLAWPTSVHVDDGTLETHFLSLIICRQCTFIWTQRQRQISCFPLISYVTHTFYCCIFDVVVFLSSTVL